MFALQFTLVVLLCLCLFQMKYATKEFSLARYNETAVYANSSFIDLNLIGEGFEEDQITGGGALECHTDDTTCCRGIDNPNGTGRGEWYYPGGTVVPPPGNNDGFHIYRTRGYMVIRLNRADATGPTGVYRCEIPSTGGVNITRYITLPLKTEENGLHCDDLHIVNGNITYTPPRMVSTEPLSAGHFQRYVGTIATYSCSSGYQLVGGSSLRACGPDRTWNGTESACDQETALNATNNTPAPGNSTTAIVAVLLVLLVLGLIALFTAILIILWRKRQLKEQVYSVRKNYESKESPSLNLETLSKFKPNKDRECDKTNTTNSKLVPPTICGIPSCLSPLEGEEVRVEAKVEGHPPLTLVWYYNEEAVVTDYSIEIDEQGSLFFPSIEFNHSGVYKVVATNDSGMAEKEVTVSVMSEGCDTVENEGSGETKIPVAEFGRFVSEHHAQGNKKFRERFERLSSGETGHTVTVSKSPENLLRNRFKNISVYNDNQIVLQPLTAGREKYENDYINASYIDGCSHCKKFIGTQGPLPNTVVDFWRMVWQERPSAIIMLTNCVEGGRVKCEQYWPDTDQSYGPFFVITTDQSIFADYAVRTFIVKNTSSLGVQSFKMTQFHFTAWPDHGVPAYASPVLSFHRLIRSHHVPSSGPLIVHCSAGVGRTGTYITLDSVLDQIEAEGLVDIDGVIVKMRNQRMKMVQTKDQYIFIHDAILEFLTCGDTQISTTNFRKTINKLSEVDPTHQCTGYQHQFNVLNQVSPSPTEVNCSTALKHPDNNRGDKYLPVETNRVILRGEQPDYIHAITANGYKHQKAYIIAQNPLQSTVRNFWKVITDRKCAVVVMLSQLEENGEESCAQYWPSEESSQFGEFTVNMVDKEGTPGFVMRKFVVESTKLTQTFQVTQFHVTNWSPDGTCSNLKVLTDVIEEVAKVQRRTGNNPILVHCSDTVSRSGMFCAIATTIDRCKTEGVVDVFQVVKALRTHKPGAVLNVNQYRLIHEAVLAYLESFETYANFKKVV